MNYERIRRTPTEQAEADRKDRRQFWIVAVVFTIAITAVTGLYVAVSDTVQPPSPQYGAAQQIDEPGMPIANGGAEPEEPGDRGGSQQIAVMVGLVVFIGGGAAWVVHSSRRARRRLAEQDADETVELDGPTIPEVSSSTGSPTPR